MARIKYVKVRGLWSHWDTLFEFGPGFTVITGPNGSGKSSVIRVIRWVATGDFPGDEPIFKLTDEATKEIIKQADEAFAEIGLDNDVVITKTRRKGKTQYTHSDYAEPWEKAEVPQEIKDALGIELIKFGDWETYLNIAFQMDAPFLISESPSVGAKVLGKLAGTEVVDLAIAETSKRVFKARDEKRIAEKEVQQRNGDLLDYQDIDDVAQQLAACNYLMEGVDKAAARRDNLAQYSNTYDAVVDKLADITIELGSYSTLVLADELLAKVIEYQERDAELTNMWAQLVAQQQTADTLAADLLDYQGVDEAAALLPKIEQASARQKALKGYDGEYEIQVRLIQCAALKLAELQGIDVAAADLKVIEIKQQRLEAMQSMDAAYRQAYNDVAAADKTLLEYSRLELAATLLQAVGNKQDNLDKLKDLAADFTTRNAVAAMAARELTAATAALEAAQKEITAAWEAAGGICPLCDQAVVHTH